MSDKSWADLIEEAQQLKAEELVPGLARMKSAYARDAANAQQRADDPSIEKIRVYPVSLSPRAMVRATLAEALLIELRYLLRTHVIFVSNLVDAVPDDCMESLAKAAKRRQHEVEVRGPIEEVVETWWKKVGDA